MFGIRVAESQTMLASPSKSLATSSTLTYPIISPTLLSSAGWNFFANLREMWRIFSSKYLLIASSFLLPARSGFERGWGKIDVTEVEVISYFICTQEDTMRFIMYRVKLAS